MPLQRMAGWQAGVIEVVGLLMSHAQSLHDGDRSEVHLGCK
jgi:hypothetical protein